MASNARQNEEIKPVTAAPAPENPTIVRNGFSIRNLLSRKKKSSVHNNGGDQSTTNQKYEVTSNGNVADRIASYRTRSADDTSKTYGFDYQITWIQDLLMQKENQWNSIGIFGSSGVGKTRLCQDIFNSKQVKEYFLPRIWVSMASRQTGEEGEPKIWILKKILDSLGVENQIVQHLSIEDLLYALKLELRGKRYLIVLDDLIEEDMFSDRLGALPSEEIGHGHLSKGFPKEYGGAIMVTSMSQKVAKNLVGEQTLHRIVGLSDPNYCWAIYKYWAEKDGLGPLEETKELKDELLQKSGGIPLVIKLMGEIKFSQLKQQQQQQQQQNSVQNSNGPNGIVVAGENSVTVI